MILYESYDFLKLLISQRFNHLSACLFSYSDWKEECVMETNLCLVFYPLQNLHFLAPSERLVSGNGQKWPLSGKYLFIFAFFTMQTA